MNAVAADFESFELNHSLFEIRIDDIPIWERLRFPVFEKIKQQNGTGTAHPDNSTAWQQYAKGAKLFCSNLVRNNPYLADESDVLYLGTRRRKQRADGYWWDIYCDPIHEACDYDYVHFEEPYFLTHRRPARTANLRYLDLITAGGKLQQLVGLNEPTIPTAERQQLKAAHETIREQFDADVNLVSMAHAELYDRRTTLPLYRHLLGQIDPELVVVIASYGRETFIEACKQRGVPVVELQHGIIHSNHFGYAYRGPRIKETFPDYLLTFGEFWTNAAEFPIPKERVIPVGYPYLEQAAHNYSSVETTDQLLFISQGPIGEQLLKFAIAVDQHPEISSKVVYKLHPGEYDRWRSEYPWLVDSEIKVIDTSEPALYRLFAESSGQVGVNSTAIYEGLQFGLETYLYDCKGGETLQPLLDDGVATLVSSVDQLISALNSGSKEFDREGSKEFDRELYFASDATSRICETLEEIQADSSE